MLINQFYNRYLVIDSCYSNRGCTREKQFYDVRNLSDLEKFKEKFSSSYHFHNPYISNFWQCIFARKIPNILASESIFLKIIDFNIYMISPRYAYLDFPGDIINIRGENWATQIYLPDLSYNSIFNYDSAFVTLPIFIRYDNRTFKINYGGIITKYDEESKENFEYTEKDVINLIENFGSSKDINHVQDYLLKRSTFFKIITEIYKTRKNKFLDNISKESNNTKPVEILYKFYKTILARITKEQLETEYSKIKTRKILAL